MGRHHASAGAGRLHGRLLQILGAFSAVVAVVALWQFGVFGGDDDREPVSTVEGPSTAWYSAEEEERSGAAGPAPSASSAPVSPTESTQEPTTAEPSETSASPEPPASTSGDAEEEESAEASCSATLTLRNDWDSGVEVSVEVVNTGSVDLDSWAIDLDIDDLDIGDDSAWNMEELRHGWYGNTRSNGRLDPGENAIAGFVGATDRGFDLPSSVTCEAEA